MGPKVTIDSASMVNKGLEVIEASWFLIRRRIRLRLSSSREKILHSAEYEDGSILAQLLGLRICAFDPVCPDMAGAYSFSSKTARL